jgi:hypothetical protein
MHFRFALMQLRRVARPHLRYIVPFFVSWPPCDGVHAPLRVCVVWAAMTVVEILLESVQHAQRPEEHWWCSNTVACMHAAVRFG